MKMWMKNHPNIAVTHYQITGLVGKVYLKSATAGIAANMFRKTGLFPGKRHTFYELHPGRKSAQRHQLFD
jgi:hypothetical protein